MKWRKIKCEQEPYNLKRKRPEHSQLAARTIRDSYYRAVEYCFDRTNRWNVNMQMNVMWCMCVCVCLSRRDAIAHSSCIHRFPIRFRLNAASLSSRFIFPIDRSLRQIITKCAQQRFIHMFHNLCNCRSTMSRWILIFFFFFYLSFHYTFTTES